MSQIENHSADLVLTDLPYSGLTQNHWDSAIDLGELWNHFRRIIKPSTAIVMTAATPFSHVLAMSNLPWLRHEWIWAKDRATNFLNSKSAPLRSHETVLVFGEGPTVYNPQMATGEPYRVNRPPQKLSRNYNGTSDKGSVLTVNSGSRFPQTILSFPTERSNIHSTQKPTPLFEYLIRTYSHEGQLVLDCCMGSGTTGVAAMNAGRNFIGFELDKDIHEKATRRLKDHERTLRKGSTG